MNIKKILLENQKRIYMGIGLLLAIVFLLVLNNSFLIWLVAGIIYLLAFNEFIRLVDVEEKKLLILAAIIWLCAYFFGYFLEVVLAILVIASSFMLYSHKFEVKNIFPFIYPTFSMLMVWSIYLNFGVLNLAWLIVVVSACDIGAYFSGKLYGKTTFSKFSPNKTKEGLYGGVIIATVLGTLFGLINYGFFASLIISFAVAFFAVWGDLFESFLKRQAGVKDSGTILLSHGGILDRIDGYLFSAIIMNILFKAII